MRVKTVLLILCSTLVLLFIAIRGMYRHQIDSFWKDLIKSQSTIINQKSEVDLHISVPKNHLSFLFKYSAKRNRKENNIAVKTHVGEDIEQVIFELGWPRYAYVKKTEIHLHVPVGENAFIVIVSDGLIAKQIFWGQHL